MFIAGFAVAGFDFKNDGIISQYNGGDIISGWVNISFENEPINSPVTSNFEGGMSLLDLLNANNLTRGSNYTCNTLGCVDKYARGNIINSLNLGESRTAGLSVQGSSFQEITQVEFKVSGNAGASCFSPLRIDLLDDGENILSSENYTDEQCFNTKYGCFEDNLESGEYQKIEIPYDGGVFCERVSLPPAPAYKIGAVIDNNGNDISDLTMGLRDLGGNVLAECTLPKNTQNIQNRECIVEYSSVDSAEYFVCVNAEETSSYKIKVEFNNVCGTDSPGSGSENIDYEIFAKNLKFGSPSIKIDSDSFEQVTRENLIEYFENHIFDNYNGNCQPNCVIPMRFIGAEQKLSFSDIILKYKIAGGAGGEIVNNRIYNVDNENAKISSGALKLELSHASFEIPSGEDERDFELIIGGERVLVNGINVSYGFDFDVYPRFSSYGRDTEFRIFSSENITSSRWKFGDGGIESVSGGSVIHRYTEQDTFMLEVSATKKDEKSSTKTFNIIIGDAREAANATITDYKERIINIQEDITRYPLWVQEILKSNLRISNLSSEVNALETRYKTTSNESSFENIMNELLELEIPKSIESSRNGTLPIGYLDFVDTRYIEDISQKSVDDRAGLESDILKWMNQNLNGNIKFESVRGNYDYGDEDIITFFSIEPKPSVELRDTFLIIDFSIDQIYFIKDYGQEEVLGATYLPIADQRIIEFAILEDVGVSSLGAYISPIVDELGSYTSIIECNYNKKCEKARGESNDNCPNDCRPYGLAIVIVLIVVLLGIIAFVGMKMWYKWNYERSLFKKRVDYVNIMNFIETAISKGLSSWEIRKRLKKAGWTGEQIGYAIKKFKRLK